VSARRLSRFLGEDSGAVAATYALALTGILVVAGVGFDYGRLAAMDSELQNGADQAALAGATQLDGQTGACARAANAAATLVNNQTLLAQGGGAVGVTAETSCDGTGSIRFWRDRDRSQAANSDANARFIEVIVDAETVNYAFTPIAGLAFGSLNAAAMAGLGSSICKVPPVFMCNPNQSADPNFTVENYIGKGLRLVANDGGGNYGAGNFGYLQNNAGNGANPIRDALGKTEVPGDCVAIEGVTTKPGAQISVLDALNTRFDIYTGNTNQPCGADGRGCPPSANTRKDLVHRGSASQCSYTTGGGNGWQLPNNPYAPTSPTTPLTNAQAAALSPMGYPRDMCHAVSQTGSCADGILGTGIWDRNAYFRSNSTNYPSGFDVLAAFGTSTPTRYQVYRYEAANAASRLLSQSAGGGATSRPQPYCSAPGVPVGGTQVDRRVLSVAVINCGSGLNGTSGPHDPMAWIDVFLTEPSVRRRVGGTTYTEASDVYIEVIGRTALAGGGSTAAQQIRRDVPYLVR
jgi:Flp pilus assembly protein TadG